MLYLHTHNEIIVKVFNPIRIPLVVKPFNI